MKIKLKRGVVLVLDSASEESPILNIILAAIKTAPRFSDDTLWITSGLDGLHSTRSYHYENRALDLRSRNITGDFPENWASRLQSELGDQYDVVVELDHIHVEFEGRRR